MKLRKERNNLRNELHHAKKLGLNADSIKSLVSKFHHLLHQYARTNRSLCKSVSNNKPDHDKKECAKHFNRFAAKGLDEDNNLSSAEPKFVVATAESYFHKVYHSEPRVFHKPQWLQDAPPPLVPFNDSLFVLGELDISHRKDEVLIVSQSSWSSSILGIQEVPFPDNNSAGLVQHVLVASISTHSLKDGCHSPHLRECC